MTRATHLAALLAAFTAGAVTTAAVHTRAAPDPAARFRALDAFAEALTLIQRRYVAPVQERDLVADAIAGMTHGLDVHSAFLPARRYQRVQQDNEGELIDVGLTLVGGAVEPSDPRRPPWPRVVAVAPGSPAALAGVQPGDEVQAIGPRATAEPGAARSLRTLQQLLRGAAGSRVTLALRRAGWKRARSLELVRARRHVASLRSIVVGEVGVLTVAAFTEHSSAELRAELRALERAGARALVLDLRDNPGGLVEQAVAVADLFLDDGVIVTVRERDRTTRHFAHAGAVTLPLYVVVNAGTASAAEIVAASLQEHERAVLVGETTYGKGTLQTLYSLGDGSGLKLTTGWLLTPAGNLLESKGIQPNVKVGGELPGANVPATSSSQTPSARVANGATIGPGFDDDPQLVAALALARNSVRGSPPIGRRGLAKP
jgi:carboxyl-terminal processing protease